jgi:hypothetical protein
VAALDGELHPLESARIEAHLSRCAACRQRLEELKTGLRLYADELAPLSADFSVEEGLGRLRTAIRSWNDQHAGESKAQEVALSLVFWETLTSELSIYMGLRTATALLEHCKRPGVQLGELTSAIEPVVTGFFGPQTGSAVAERVVHIWDHAQGAAPSRSSL